MRPGPDVIVQADGAGIIVHAGAGGWTSGRLDEATAACVRAVRRSQEILQGGGTAVEAVLAAVVVLEDDPACNAGTGAVPAGDGAAELDACVMDGRSRTSGAVGALREFKNPVLVAEDVRRDGRYHLLVSEGAAAFAADHGWAPAPVVTRPGADRGNTVGAVALDASGGLAAATSTGGVAGQPLGRIGDTPIVGAGTYADERAACSCTGAGESFARACTAFWAVDRSPGAVEQAAQNALDRTRRDFGGIGGLILLGRDGSFGVERTAAAMPWARGWGALEPTAGH